MKNNEIFSDYHISHLSLTTLVFGAIFTLFSLSISFTLAHAQQKEIEWEVPIPKKVDLSSTSSIKLGSNTILNAPENLKKHYPYILGELRNMLRGLPSQKRATTIQVNITKSFISDLPQNDDMLAKPEMYFLRIHSNRIELFGSDNPGILHGLETLKFLINNFAGQIPLGIVMDYPDHKIRALHFVARMLDVNDAKKMILSARQYHFNTLIILLSDGIRFKSMERLVNAHAWSLKQFRSVLDYAKMNGFVVIPEIKFLTQQQHLLKDAHPEVMFNRFTYDPRMASTYAVVLPMLDEVIDFMRPPAVHIGHDEVFGLEFSTQNQLTRDEYPLSSDLFLEDVVKLHTYLQKRSVETWMWGDMLISLEEFPGEKHLNASPSYAALRNQIPKDVVICDWHYFDQALQSFPSADAFIQTGHDILGATWNVEKTTKSFSQYLARRSKATRGMIATTWYFTQRKDWDTVNRIIKISGESFWNAN